MSAELPVSDLERPAVRATRLRDLLDECALEYGAAPALAIATGDVLGRYDRIGFDSFVNDVRRRANGLRNEGVGAGDVVAFMLPLHQSSLQMLLGAACVGTTICLNYFLELPALVSLVRASGAKYLVSVETAADDANYPSKIAGLLDALPEIKHIRFGAGYGEAFERRALALSGDQWPADESLDYGRIAMIFHSSGSTGAPKLIPFRERNLVTTAIAAGRQAHNGPGEIMLSGLPLFHVGGAFVAGLFPILCGTELVIPSLQGFRDPDLVGKYWDVVEHLGATLSASVPTALAAISNSPCPKPPRSLKYILSGGASLAESVIEKLARIVPDAQVLEGWGMTETAGICTLTLPGSAKCGSSGRPFDGTRLRSVMMSETGDILRDCAVGEIGELLVRGPQLFEGYLDGPRLAEADDGWFRTGDRAKIDEDGELWIVGRSKDVIIRGGHNIDPSAIEVALLAHEAVESAAAVPYPDRYAGEVPCAFMVLRAGFEASDKDLLDFLSARLLERAAIPKRLSRLPVMPLTGSGKIDKVQLRSLAISQAIVEAVETMAPAMVGIASIGVNETASGPELLVCISDQTRDRMRDIERIIKEFPQPFQVRWRQLST